MAFSLTNENIPPIVDITSILLLDADLLVCHFFCGDGGNANDPPLCTLLLIHQHITTNAKFPNHKYIKNKKTGVSKI